MFCVSAGSVAVGVCRWVLVFCCCCCLVVFVLCGCILVSIKCSFI
jgi:hypothetical protein